jgi:hypothetical protein
MNGVFDSITPLKSGGFRRRLHPYNGIIFPKKGASYPVKQILPSIFQTKIHYINILQSGILLAVNIAITTKKKILLIDDDKDFLYATRLILEKGRQSGLTFLRL